MPKKWVIKEYSAPNAELIEAAGSELLAKLLLQRGIDTPAKVDKFLNPLNIEPVSPYAFKDMKVALNRIKQAMANNEHILVYGDFDADGVTSTAVLYKTLVHIGANVSYYIPDRQSESHGLNKGVLLKKISKERVKLIITVDCGVNDVEEIALAKTFGADTIITDHHEAKPELPQAIAIINAKAQNALLDDLNIEDIDSLASMAGVGTAFKLACALLDDAGKINFTEELLPLVAVGTVADIVPLLHENRLFVKLGLELIGKGKNPGLTEILNSAGISSDEEITSEKIAFAIAPRINAAGRLDSAETAFRLLTCDNPAEIKICAEMLNNYNKMRQQLVDQTYIEALEYIEANNEANEAVIFAYNKNWHVGIIGIVASKLAEHFNKPVFMFTDSPDGEAYRSSVRSVSGINIFNVIDINSNLMLSFGGHSMAAGLALDKKVVSLSEFKSAINQTVLEITDGKLLQPELEIDLEISASDLGIEFLENLNKLEPCGEANEYPIFAIKGLKLLNEKTIGADNNHLKFSCVDANSVTVDCVYWKHTTLNIPQNGSLDIAFYPKINEFNGSKLLQLDIKDYNSDDIVVNGKKRLKLIDHRKKCGILSQVADYIRNSKSTFKIFAEDKTIIKNLSQYDNISQNIVTRLNVTPSDQLMFFDYPADEKLLNFMIKASNPQIVHFMNYKVPLADIDALIAKISGMFKYAHKHYDGVVYLPNISAALSITDELSTLITKLLNKTEVINVTDFQQGKVYFKFNKAISIEVIKANELYEKCRMELFKSKNFRENLLDTDNLKKFVKVD